MTGILANFGLIKSIWSSCGQKLVGLSSKSMEFISEKKLLTKIGRKWPEFWDRSFDNRRKRRWRWSTRSGGTLTINQAVGWNGQKEKKKLGGNHLKNDSENRFKNQQWNEMEEKHKNKKWKNKTKFQYDWHHRASIRSFLWLFDEMFRRVWWVGEGKEGEEEKKWSSKRNETKQCGWKLWICCVVDCRCIDSDSSSSRNCFSPRDGTLFFFQSNYRSIKFHC